ncbi:3-carboxy-cis,cis-muconate cycloisomerase [Duganella sp. BJB488]|uniref:3-carboxy-cis,cis-muconate cycloisomerase n=1 Tax=unclassified Duganella TaxID=2636909 RepID=UPI000E34A8BA|nr:MULTISPECIES: 3-carboxy-cis,cis-muconate cycloisomerase [unclassified Duganella]RFP17773.1 3-carboxy-cis,cis-muconate cycloisomerase [Duganella sp. BJB489]RFP22281.1 3-carboxy-cis,cis-muconate cycloisomerase [Duganella sp. BJB488]RFP37614.1 3-carboxy-cis,cis-muconate cycloisomerase [Duganella sp. BJB480]
MSVSIFDSFLTTPDMIAVFDDAAIVQAMLRFEQALAEAQARQGMLPAQSARAIAGVCNAQLYDIPAIVSAGRRAGSLAIPLVRELTRTVALYDAEAAARVHWGSTSQDVIDTAMVLATRDALQLLDDGLHDLTGHLLQLADRHVATPVLARTLMQPAQVSSFGFKVAGWLAPLVRARTRLRECAARALQLQLGGAVGTLSVMGEHGAAVAALVAADLGLKVADAAWHTQRDEWVRLGLEVAVLTGSLGKIATDISLMAQGEIAELAEPSGNGRGGSSAMPHKRNPVSAMIALAAATRTPQHAAALLASMGQQHERGLGNWQAELAEWPTLFLSAHGAVQALNDAFAGLQVDPARMLRNIDALQGLVFAEAASAWLTASIGRPAAHSLLEAMSGEALASGRNLAEVLADAVRADEQLRKQVDPAALTPLFDPAAAALPAQRLAQHQLQSLRVQIAALNSTPFHHRTPA